MATTAVIPNPQQAANPVAGSGIAQSQAAIPGATSPANPQSTTVANPMAAPGAVPTSATTVQGNAPGTVAQTNGVNWVDGSNTVIGDFKDTYGAGTGTALASALQGLGTSTSNAVNATEANTNLEAANQYKNIQATEAAQGVTPNSSTAALAQGDFYSQVNSSLQATTANMEEQEQTELISALQGEGAAHGPDESGFDSVLSGITDAGEIGSAIAML